MTNYYFNKNLTCFFLFALAVSLFSLGCSSTSWQKRSMVSYQSTGEVLQASKSVSKALCINGTLSNDECADAKEVYNNAVIIYRLLGTTMIMAIGIDDKEAMKAEILKARDSVTFWE